MNRTVTPPSFRIRAASSPPPAPNDSLAVVCIAAQTRPNQRVRLEMRQTLESGMNPWKP
jgi:hypothetical protein